MDERVLCRMDLPTKAALDEYSRRLGVNAASTALRMIAVEKLRGEGLL